MQDLDSRIKNLLDETNSDTLKILIVGNLLPNFVKNFFVYEIARKVTLEQNVLENEREFFESKINQLSEINKLQENAIHQASEHAANLEYIIEVERSARLDLQQLFDERSQSFSYASPKISTSFVIRANLPSALLL